MTLKQKTDPWSDMDLGVMKRVDSKGRYDFFWTKVEANAPALLLRLEPGQEEIKPLPKLKNVDVRYRALGERRAFIVSLLEQAQIDLFEVLCRDIVEAGENAEEATAALSRSIRRTQRWHHLLRGGSLKRLSVEEQRGLVGELSVLRSLVDAIGPDAAIEGWTGPSGSSKDFELGSTCIEVKAKRSAAKPYVRISSEDQLSDVPGARLFLHVADVASAIKPKGRTLHDHVKDTEQLLVSAGDAFGTWEAAIMATGYDKSHDYEDRRWDLVGAKNFEVLNGFPRLNTPLPYGVTAASYSISLDACEPFEVQGDLFLTVSKEHDIE
ncbi:PD-(D/E)XK motif protein [Falsiruegeria mediterranea]